MIGIDLSFYNQVIIHGSVNHIEIKLDHPPYPPPPVYPGTTKIKTSKIGGEGEIYRVQASRKHS